MKPAATAQLGRTGLAVTRLSFGTAPLGNLFEAVSDAAARAVEFVGLPVYSWGAAAGLAIDAYVRSHRRYRNMTSESTPAAQDAKNHGKRPGVPASLIAGRCGRASRAVWNASAAASTPVPTAWW